MLEAFRKAFKIKDIRKKIGYTFLMLIVIRIGSQLPTPGVNGEYIKNFFAQNTGEAFNLFNAFTGGSFEQMSVFALSITPYYFINHSSAAYNCNSAVGRNAA